MTESTKAVIVTGASQGIGAGLVAALRKKGHSVIATSRSITDSDDPEVVTVAGDIADPDTAQRVVDAAIERFGRIDTLINNAGSSSPSPSPTTPRPTSPPPWLSTSPVSSTSPSAPCGPCASRGPGMSSPSPPAW